MEAKKGKRKVWYAKTIVNNNGNVQEMRTDSPWNPGKTKNKHKPTK